MMRQFKTSPVPAIRKERRWSAPGKSFAIAAGVNLICALLIVTIAMVVIGFFK
jgi:hypothetical protein